MCSDGLPRGLPRLPARASTLLSPLDSRPSSWAKAWTRKVESSWSGTEVEAKTPLGAHQGHFDVTCARGLTSTVDWFEATDQVHLGAPARLMGHWSPCGVLTWD